MRITKNYSPHIISALCLTVLGQAVIYVPYKTADVYSFLGFALAAILGVLFIFLLSFLLPKEESITSKKGVKRNFLNVILVLFAFGCILSLYLSLKAFLDFSAQVLLPRAHQFFPFFIIVLTLIFFGRIKAEAILKFCLISALPSLLIILILFILCIPSMKLINISVFSLPPLTDLIKSAFPYFIKVFLTAAPAVIFTKSLSGDIKKGSLLVGAALGALSLGAVFLQSMLILGTGVNSFDFPYLSSVGTLTFGNLFTRLDGFVYFLFFVCVIIKSAVCIHAAKYLLKLLKAKNSP